jgi:hypothetical protein
MQGILPILTLFLAPFSVSIPIKSFICPGFMFIQQALGIAHNILVLVGNAHPTYILHINKLYQSKNP